MEQRLQWEKKIYEWLVPIRLDIITFNSLQCGLIKSAFNLRGKENQQANISNVTTLASVGCMEYIRDSYALRHPASFSIKFGNTGFVNALLQKKL